MRPLLLPLAALLAGLALACGPSARAPAKTAEAGAGADAFDVREDELLRELAAIDPRFAKRARLTPSEQDLGRIAIAAVLREDPGVAVIDGSVDPFSFDARERGLATAASKIAGLPADPSRAAERELLARTVTAEQARLEEERALPRSASALVRAIVDTWTPPPDPRQAADTDRWLARRLRELGDAVTASSGDPERSLDVVRARELDDALDALERILSAPGYTTAMQELVRLRESLEAAASRPRATARSEWATVARRLQAQLGLTTSSGELTSRLAEAERDLRARAEAAASAAGLTKDALETSLGKEVLVTGPCLDAVPGSPVRSIAAPPERAPSCHLRHLVAAAGDDAGRALALAVMHDHVVVALWATLVSAGDATIADAQGRYHLLVPVLPDTRARYERLALARPVATIGAGETARMLTADPKATATAWSAIGDVPLDVARRELAARR